MTNFKLAISDKKGKSITKELKDTEANPLLGLQVGSDVDATIVGMSGKMRITGGSDKSGVPMRSDVHGMARKYVLLSKGVGFQENEKGLRKRKLVRGNIISDEIFQINIKFDVLSSRSSKASFGPNIVVFNLSKIVKLFVVDLIL